MTKSLSLSNHPISHKLASFNCYLERLLRVPLSIENYNRELNTIKNIAHLHNYDHSLIDKMLRKKQNRIIQNTTFITNPIPVEASISKYMSLTYIGNISYKVSNILKNHFKISFKSSNSISNFFIKNKDKVDIMDQPGIYELSCKSCPAKYVGRTFRNFRTRLKEHLRCLNTATTGFSHFATHLVESNHDFDSGDGFRVLHICHNKLILNNLENLEIFRLRKSTNALSLNSQVFSESTPTFSVLF